MALLIGTDNNLRIVNLPPEDHPDRLHAMQKCVGGMIERIQFPAGAPFTAWCNEEGLIYNMQPNLAFHFLFGLGIVAGPVLIEDMDDDMIQTAYDALRQ